MSIADRPGLAVGFAGGVLAMNGTNFAGIAAGETTGILSYSCTSAAGSMTTALPASEMSRKLLV